MAARLWQAAVSTQHDSEVAARCHCGQSSRNGSEDSQLSDKEDDGSAAEERASTASMRDVSQGFASGIKSGVDDRERERAESGVVTGVPGASSQLQRGVEKACQSIWDDMGLMGGRTETWLLRTRGTLSLDPAGRPRFRRWAWACAVVCVFLGSIFTALIRIKQRKLDIFSLGALAVL